MKNFLTGGKAAVFFLMISTGVFAQTITGITPNASAPQNIKVIISGEGTTFFQETSTVTNVWLTKGDEVITATGWRGMDATTIEAVFDVPAHTPVGIWDLHVSDSVDGELPPLTEEFLIYLYPDLNEDGRVDNEDLALLTKNWLKAQVEVPDCSGLNQAAAEASLTASSLATGAILWSYHDTIMAGKAIHTEPAAGNTVHSGSAVNLVFSMGPYQTVEPEGMVWLEINDPGIADHEGFSGRMSKYETTNAQYCHYLNGALASGDITISGNEVLGADGFNEGDDFVGQIYYNLAGPGYTVNGASSGGATHIHYTAGVFRVDSGFENHPVTYVSWYGAAAFCNFYGYQLPTEWQWQAVADYDGSFTYGCGTAIHTGIANYCDSVHPQGTTAAGAFGSYGYGVCDMAGNVWEWTSTVSGSGMIVRGGAWNSSPESCTVIKKLVYKQINTSGSFGFRACR